MSFRYSSCFSFSSPNMRSVSTSEKPMMAFNGVRSSWDMLARNSDLCRLAALVLDLVKEPGILDSQGRLGREGAKQLHRLGRKLSGAVARNAETPDEPIFADHRHGQDGPDPGFDQGLP